MEEQRYDFEIDLANRNSGHTLMLEMVGAAKRVLEVGCATGYMSRIMADRGCRVVGVEIDPEAAARAKVHCEDVVVADVERLDLETLFGRASFDAAVFGDVLEHLRDPVGTLQKVRPLMTQGGFVVASIPNVAHGAVRLALLQGRFRYTPLGLLDSTHLRFFTREAVEDLFRDAGFAVVETRRTRVGIRETEVDVDPSAFPPEIVAMVEQDPEAETYQFIVKAVPDDGMEGVRELHEREEVQRAEIMRLEGELERLAGEAGDARDAEASLRERCGALEAELATLNDALSAARGELDEVRGSLAAARDEARLHRERLARLHASLPIRIYHFLKRIAGVRGGAET